VTRASWSSRESNCELHELSRVDIRKAHCMTRARPQSKQRLDQRLLAILEQRPLVLHHLPQQHQRLLDNVSALSISSPLSLLVKLTCSGRKSCISPPHIRVNSFPSSHTARPAATPSCSAASAPSVATSGCSAENNASFCRFRISTLPDSSASTSAAIADAGDGDVSLRGEALAFTASQPRR
jgi:hypothetical protein